MLDKLKRLKDDLACNNALIAIAEGNTEALSVLYRIYGRMIMSVSLQILKNQHDAEDALQEVFLCIAQNAGQYHRNTNPRAWVMAITRNTAIDRLKEQMRFVPYEDIAAEAHALREPGSDPSTSLLIGDALSKLSETDQTIVRLKLFVGLSHAEIASVMNLTKAGAEKRYERAIHKVREYFLKG